MFDLTSCFSRDKPCGEETIRVVKGVPHLIWLICLFLLVVPIKVESFPHHSPVVSFLNPFQLDSWEDLRAFKRNDPHGPVSLDHPGELVSITQLLSEPSLYHKKIIKIRGTVTQPELHVDESGLFIRFVFVLKDAEKTLIVFGHHDRTQGNIQIEMNEKVEVIGIFWKERTANDHHFRNNLEAITVTRYPQLHPDAA